MLSAGTIGVVEVSARIVAIEKVKVNHGQRVVLLKLTTHFAWLQNSSRFVRRLVPIPEVALLYLARVSP